MKNVLFILIAVLIIGGGFFYFKSPPYSYTAKTVPTSVPATEEKVEAFSTTAPVQDQLSKDTPELLLIPNLHIEAPVEEVGMDAKEKMDTPKNSDNAGWYKLGYRPGDKGSVVMAGHYDKEDGSPAAFYNLKQAKEGDEVIVKMQSGKGYRYKVTKTQLYLYDKVPLQSIFADSSKPALNLITCSGSWDKGSTNYTQRLVVYTEQLP